MKRSVSIRTPAISHVNGVRQPKGAGWIYEFNGEAVIATIENAAEQGLMRIVASLAEQARESGSYTNRTGNLRTLITPSMFHSEDDPEDYPATPVTYIGDNGLPETRLKYTPPSEFFDPDVETTPTEITGRVTALMGYAAAVESRGYDVLSHVFVDLLSNPEKYFIEIADAVERSSVAASLTVTRGV